MASQQSTKVLPTSPPGDRDERWLLSCRFGENKAWALKDTERMDAIVQMLGEDLVNNPNRFSKSCCTVGDEWDDNYNKGDNEEKYRRCWDPTAHEELRCTKPVADGQEPTEMNCWKSSYFWRLKKCRKMLRLRFPGNDESYSLGEGQKIEKDMADFLEQKGGGCEVREIRIKGFKDNDNLIVYMMDSMHSLAPVMGFADMEKSTKGGVSVQHVLMALHHAQELAEMELSEKPTSPLTMMVKLIREADKSSLRFLARNLFRLQQIDGYLSSDFYRKAKLRYKSSTDVILSDLEAFQQNPDLDGDNTNNNWEELERCTESALGNWFYWHWYHSPTSTEKHRQEAPPTKAKHQQAPSSTFKNPFRLHEQSPRELVEINRLIYHGLDWINGFVQPIIAAFFFTAGWLVLFFVTFMLERLRDFGAVCKPVLSFVMFSTLKRFTVLRTAKALATIFCIAAAVLYRGDVAEIHTAVFVLFLACIAVWLVPFFVTFTLRRLGDVGAVCKAVLSLPFVQEVLGTRVLAIAAVATVWMYSIEANLTFARISMRIEALKYLRESAIIASRVAMVLASLICVWKCASLFCTE